MKTETNNELLGLVLFERIINLIEQNDLSTLKQIGINQTIINIINAAGIKQKDLIAAILGKSSQISINTQSFITTINGAKKINENNKLLIELIKVGATFELVKNFYPSYSNRKHTALRVKLGINGLILFKDNLINQPDLYQYFYNIEQQGKNVAVLDLYQYHQDKKVSINKVYKNLKSYLEDKA